MEWKWNKKKVRKLNVATHRDFGYFFSGLIIIYCISGLALNHVDDWNADFILTKDTIQLNQTYNQADINENVIQQLSEKVGEDKYKVFDFPTNNQVKIYFKESSLHVYFKDGYGIYEKVAKRPVIYQTNVLHRNSLKGWKWASDVFAVMLILITVTGLFILKGKNGISGRGKWLIASGFIPPIIAIIIQAFME